MLALIIYSVISIRDFVLGMDPAYVDLFKIFAGCIGWVGGLTMYMWFREKKKEAARSLAVQQLAH